MVRRVKTFEELCENRKKWVDISKDNDFDEGILKLLTELYPDKAHFVYELLQNAEDAKATKVSFKLYKDRLEFVHNGSRLFSLDDIDSITSISGSTKSDKQGTSIGKFGVGFKSVFSYTDSPEIKSGEWHFEINNLVVPCISHAPIDAEFDKEDFTFFRFPFNNPKKSPEKAYQEILDSLTSLPLETLLFLNNISQLSWKTESDTKVIEKEEKDHLVVLSEKKSGKIAKYLKFISVNQTIETEDGNRDVSVSLAYRLARKNVNSSKLKLVPTEGDKNVYIFFPAEKESSRLRFLINAPFSSPVSRDSVRHTPDNMKLIEILVKLQEESLDFLKKNGYLDVDAIEVFPNSKDGLDVFYENFYSNLRTLFQYMPYVPTKNGKHQSASKAFQGGADISDILSDDDLAEITNKRYTPLWAVNAYKNSNADKFLLDLNIQKWDKTELLSFFQNCDYDLCRKIFKNKSENVFRKLYNFLTIDPLVTQIKAPVFLTETNELKTVDDDVFMPGDDDRNVPQHIQNVISSSIFKGLTKEQKDRLKLSLELLGVKKYTSETNFQFYLKKYSKSYEMSSRNDAFLHIADIHRILDSNLDCSELRNKYFILDDEDVLRKPSELYIDDPYMETNLQYIESVTHLHKVSKIYKYELNSSDLKAFLELIKMLGVISEIDLVKENYINKLNPQYNYLIRDSEKESIHVIASDYNMKYIDEICQNENTLKKLSKSIWNTVVKVSENETKALYQANKRADLRIAPSTFIAKLSRTAWILDKKGNLNYPQNAAFKDIPDDWEKPLCIDNNPGLKAIEFAKNDLDFLKEYEEKNESAKKIGFENNDEAQEARKLLEVFKESGKSFSDVKDFFKPMHQNDFPSSISLNPERRSEKTKTEYNNSPEKTYEIRERSVHISGNGISAKAREFLKSEYTEDSKMYCQLCHNQMPFNKRDGTPFFEAIEIFSNLKKDFEKQYLALCPNCAAEYDEWVRKDKADLQKSIGNCIITTKYNGEKSVDISFKIHNANKILRFGGKHFVDVRIAMCSEMGIDTSQQKQNTSDDKWISLEDFPVLKLKKGDAVRHLKYGEGVVVESENAKKVRVKFLDKEIRIISKEYLKKKKDN